LQKAAVTLLKGAVTFRPAAAASCLGTAGFASFVRVSEPTARRQPVFFSSPYQKLVFVRPAASATNDISEPKTSLKKQKAPASELAGAKDSKSD
jgi:hypothetical protein